MKVLLSAYACAPGKGSEPEIGWRWMQQISRTHETWVITRDAKRAAVETGLRSEPAPNVRFVYVDLPRALRFWKSWPFGIYAYYAVWQFLAYREALRLRREIRFDVVHHVTFCAWWMPTFMARLGVPFVWGPVGGGETAPANFRRALPWRSRLTELLRDAVQALAGCSPLLRFTAKHSVVALATSDQTAARLARLGCGDVRVASSVGVTARELADSGAPTARRDGKLRLVSAGRLLYWKGFDLAIKAVAELGPMACHVEYAIFGDGPERRRLERLARRLGVSDRVTFYGPLPRAELLRRMAESDILLHPSLHDSGGFVCVEAMMSGCPVICLDLGGPALQVTDETGIRVPAKSPKQATADIAAAIRMLADREVRRRFARAARERASADLGWDHKLDELREVYPISEEVHA